MKTPVLFTIFRRRDTALKVFSAIKMYAPEQLFIAADGPRENRPGERELCLALREEILNSIDWDCRVFTLFREHNLGCGEAMAGAVSWFFSCVQEGIILEDDCKPAPDFFRYCEKALDFYRNEEKVMCINGSQSAANLDYAPYCAGFSRYAQIWGWASWRRAWRHYSYDCAGADFKTLNRTLQNPAKTRRWLEIIKSVRTGRPGFDTWDFQWSAALLMHGGAALTPQANLISNIGAEDSTHDMPDLHKKQPLPATAMPDGMNFPAEIVFDDLRDDFIFDRFYRKPPLLSRATAKIRKILCG